jgi:hypothetical protein
MIKAFIPKNFYAKASDGKMKKIYVVEVKRYSYRPDIYLDMYYESHRACCQWTTEEEMLKIEKIEESDEVIPLFEKAMLTTPITKD